MVYDNPQDPYATGETPKYFISGKPKVFTPQNWILIAGLVLMTLLLGVFCFLSYQSTNESITTITESHTRSASEAMALAGVVLLEQSDTALGASKFIENALAADPDLVSVRIKDADGQTVFESGRVEADDAAFINQQISKLHTGNDEDGDTIGTLEVTFREKAKSQVAQALRTTVLVTFFSAWIIGCLVLVALIWLVSKQLRILAQGVKRLSSGDFGYRIPTRELWGELKHLAEAFNDMSQRLRLYEDQNIDTLTFERNKLEAILLSISNGVMVTDNDHVIVIMNDSACQMLDISSAGDLLDRPVSAYTNDEGESCFEPIFKDFQRQLNRGMDMHDTIFTRTVELGARSLQVIISPIYDAEGVSLGAVTIMHDITRETEIDRMKTQFISNVSHELRTPVTTIKSYVDTLYNHGQELDKETYQEFLETINNESDRLKKMVNDILDFSRLEAPEYKMEMDYQDISPLINLTIQSIKMLAEQKDLTISTAIETGLPKVYMNSDSIERVLRNLLSNAIKYTDEGGRIKVRAELSSDGACLEVSVEDTGVGVPYEHLDRIWDRFYRIENKVHTVKGTGLGLHLVKVAIEEHHHGQVFVRSELGQGSVFGFRIPLTPGGDAINSSVSDDDYETTRPRRSSLSAQ
ncbi:MAG: HAMP domain-containing protein [Cyanobacteria bacterium HKST-UBA04]|nr:HAMP domain-containing protein [Cyanobacteria bacterium HKST-UBA04]